MKYFIGVELGVINTNVGITDKYCRLIRKDNIPTLKDRPFEEIIKDIVELIKSLLDRENISIKDVKAIGIGTPGIPNDEKGIIVRNYTLGFHNTPIRAEVQKHINVPVFVDNDANCAALAESVTGAAEDIDHSVTVRIGNGIGGGIIINNKIYSGFNFAGAEMGHMVISMEGEQCTCGRKGCWEAYASGTALISQTRHAGKKNPQSLINKLVDGDLSKVTVFTALEAAKQDDAVAKQVMQKYMLYLAEGIVNIINILQPELVIIGGEISKMGDQLIKPVKQLVSERVYSKEIPIPEIRASEMGSGSVMMGAAMLGLYRS